MSRMVPAMIVVGLGMLLIAALAGVVLWMQSQKKGEKTAAKLKVVKSAKPVGAEA